MLYYSGSQSVPRGFQGIRDQLPGVLWRHFCNGYFEVYLFFKLKEWFAKNNQGTSLICNIFTWARMWGSLLFFEAERGPRAKNFEKQYLLISVLRKFRLALDLPVLDYCVSREMSILPSSLRVSKSWIIPAGQAVCCPRRMESLHHSVYKNWPIAKSLEPIAHSRTLFI
jgi:hypothetical protein